jgi:hypothetical protein
LGDQKWGRSWDSKNTSCQRETQGRGHIGRISDPSHCGSRMKTLGLSEVKKRIRQGSLRCARSSIVRREANGTYLMRYRNTKPARMHEIPEQQSLVFCGAFDTSEPGMAEVIIANNGVNMSERTISKTSEPRDVTVKRLDSSTLLSHRIFKVLRVT